MKVNRNVVKKMMFLCLSFILCIVMIGCSDMGGKQIKDLVVSSKEVPFINCEEGFGVSDLEAVKLYFIDDGSLPYIDVVSYLSMIDVMTQLEVTDVLTEGNQLTIEYDPITHQNIFTNASTPNMKDSNYRQSMKIDFDEDTISVSSYLFFMYLGAESFTSEADSVGITDVSIEQGNLVNIPFNEYGFDFIVNEEEGEFGYLIPFHVASLLFNNSMRYKTYYNGDEIYGGGLCIYRDEEVRISSLNGTEIPKDVREASYNLFTLALDYFSPIKYSRDVDSYHDLFENKLVTLTYSTTNDYYYEFIKLLYKVDDLHADLPALGYYSSLPNEPLSLNPAWYLPIRTEYHNTLEQYASTFKDVHQFTSEPPTVRLIDDDRIAVIYLYQFNEIIIDEFQSYLDDLPSSVEDVVIDLTMNGGGMVHSIFRLLGYMTEEPIVFINGIPIDGSSRTFTVEVNQEVYDYDWYIVTSKASYSAANITALLAQENNIATIVGEQSSGGASPVESIILPCGLSLVISGNYTFYSEQGTSEYGIPVDIPMTDFWDDNELIEIVSQQTLDN